MMLAPCRSRSDVRGTSSAPTWKWWATSSTRASNVGSMPGNANATLPPAATRPSGANHTSLRPRHAWPRSTTLRASSRRFGVGSAMARRTGPGGPSAPRSDPASTARSSSSRASRSAGRSPVATNSRVASSPAGVPPSARRRRGRPQRSAGASSASDPAVPGRSAVAAVNGSVPVGSGATPSRMTWALIPPNPNALIPTRRGSPSPSHGRASRDDLEPAGGEVGVGLVAVQGRRHDAVVEGERRLDQARDPAGGHGVADVRLHRAEAHGGPRVDAVGLEHPAQRGDLDAVAGPGRRAVRLDQPDRGGIDVGDLPGPLDGEHLALAGRAHERGGATVARHARPADRRRRPDRRRARRPRAA